MVRQRPLTHHIQLKENTPPIHIPAYYMPHCQRPILERMVIYMLEQDNTESSVSPFNSLMFLVPKPKNEWRVVVHFRALNKAILPFRYSMPFPEEIIYSLGNSNSIFSTLDLYSGFYQVNLTPESREIITFK